MFLWRSIDFGISLWPHESEDWPRDRVSTRQNDSNGHAVPLTLQEYGCARSDGVGRKRVSPRCSGNSSQTCL